MMKIQRAICLLALIMAPKSSFAQSSSGFSYGQVITAGQWNAAFASKQDVLRFTPLNTAGGTMTGRLQTSPSTINGAGFSVLPGIAPTSPANGDIWSTNGGLFIQANGQTINLGALSSLTLPLAIGNGGTGATTAASALSALGAAPIIAPNFTGPATFASGSAASPTALSVLPSTNATSRRASIQMDAWAFAQDLAANGTKDFGLYSSGYGGFALTFDASGNATFATAPKGPTQTAGDNSTKLATTAYVDRAAGSATASVPVSPQGRLTLTSGVPVLTSAVSAATSVFYTPYLGNQIPLWNGTAFVMTPFTERSLSTSSLAAGNLYDVCIWNNGGTATATFSPSWSAGATAGSNTARGSGAGSAALTRVNGILVNATAFSGGPAAGYCTFVGTVATDSTGATVSFIRGGAASGGAAATIGLWNAFNRVGVVGQVSDTTASWTYSTGAWRSANASNGMRATFVVGLAEDAWRGTYTAAATGPSSGAAASGVAIDRTNGADGVQGFIGAPQNTSTLPATAVINGLLGQHFLQATEFGNGNGVTFYGLGSTIAQTGMTFEGRF